MRGSGGMLHVELRGTATMELNVGTAAGVMLVLPCASVCGGVLVCLCATGHDCQCFLEWPEVVARGCLR